MTKAINAFKNIKNIQGAKNSWTPSTLITGMVEQKKFQGIEAALKKGKSGFIDDLAKLENSGAISSTRIHEAKELNSKNHVDRLFAGSMHTPEVINKIKNNIYKAVSKKAYSQGAWGL